MPKDSAAQPADAPQMRAVERISAVLRCFAGGSSQLPLSKIAAQAGLDKNTARRLLMALAQTGMIQRDGDLYGLGIEVLKLQPAVLASASLREISAIQLTRLTQSSGMTSFIWIPDAAGAVCIERVRSATGLTDLTWSSPGRIIPLHLAGGPRALLAHIAPEQRAAWLAGLLIAPTPWSEGDPARIEAGLALIRKQGFSYIANDFVVGLAGLGVPVFDRQGTVVAAVSITGPVLEFERPGRFDHLCSAVRDCAAAVGIRLGQL